MSQSFNISSPEFISVLKGLAIAEGGAILFTAASFLASGSFDWHVFLVTEGTAISSTLVNFLRKYIPDTQS